MKLIYKPTQKAYRTEGKQHINFQGKKLYSLEETMDVFPQIPDLFSSNQPRKLILNTTLEGSLSMPEPLKSFSSDILSVMQNLHVEFNSKNKPVKILNQKEIWQQWLALSPILSSRYEGQWVDQQIHHLTHKLGDEKQLIASLQESLILQELYTTDIFALKFNDKTLQAESVALERVQGIPLTLSQHFNLEERNGKTNLTCNSRAEKPKELNRFASFLERNFNYPFQGITHITKLIRWESITHFGVPESLASTLNVYRNDELICQIEKTLKTRFLSAEEIKEKTETQLYN